MTRESSYLSRAAIETVSQFLLEHLNFRAQKLQTHATIIAKMMILALIVERRPTN